MNVIEEYFLEIVKAILTMTFTGSIVSIFLFALKPMIKDKLPKSFQYYMWFPVIIALILPLSKIAALPAPRSSTTSMKSMYDIAQWVSDIAFEKPVNFVSVPQAGGEQEILQTTVHHPNIATILFIPASNEPSSRACTDIWRMPRGSHTPLLCSVASLMPRCLQQGC